MPPNGGTTEQEIFEKFPALFLPGNRKKGGHSLPCPHHDIAIIKRSSRRSAVASAVQGHKGSPYERTLKKLPALLILAALYEKHSWKSDCESDCSSSG